jgi:signal transduction histidine kinase
MGIYNPKSDAYVWLSVNSTPEFLTGEKKPFQAYAVFRDITERKRAEDVLKEYNARLETAVELRTSELRETQEKLVRQEKLAVLGQLAGSVGHELRNPLAVINNALYYLKLVGADSSEKVKEYLGIIQTEAHTAEKIITDLLDFARIKSVDVEAVSAFRLVERVFERYPAPNSVNVTLEIPADLPMLYVDPRQMEQVLGNLIINACQAMTIGGDSTGGKLTITARQEQEMIAIVMKDTGVGISPENMKKLFEPLFTTKAKGIGLGLAVSQKLVEANGGRIEVQSEAGKGSTFTVYLPVKQ